MPRRHTFFQFLVLFYMLAGVFAFAVATNFIQVSPFENIWHIVFAVVLFIGACHKAFMMGLSTIVIIVSLYLFSMGNSAVGLILIGICLIAVGISMFYVEAREGYVGPAPTYRG